MDNIKNEYDLIRAQYRFRRAEREFNRRFGIGIYSKETSMLDLDIMDEKRDGLHIEVGK